LNYYYQVVLIHELESRNGLSDYVLEDNVTLQ
jgi:hypothetical protein